MSILVKDGKGRMTDGANAYRIPGHPDLRVEPLYDDPDDVYDGKRAAARLYGWAVVDEREPVQVVNDAAINVADIMVYLTPEGVPADGTAEEIAVADRLGIPTLHLPPGSDSDLFAAVQYLNEQSASKGPSRHA